jgi:hypothetical protein
MRGRVKICSLYRCANPALVYPGSVAALHAFNGALLLLKSFVMAQKSLPMSACSRPDDDPLWIGRCRPVPSGGGCPVHGSPQPSSASCPRSVRPTLSTGMPPQAAWIEPIVDPDRLREDRPARLSQVLAPDPAGTTIFKSGRACQAHSDSDRTVCLRIRRQPSQR